MLSTAKLFFSELCRFLCSFLPSYGTSSRYLADKRALVYSLAFKSMLDTVFQEKSELEHARKWKCKERCCPLEVQRGKHRSLYKMVIKQEVEELQRDVVN